MDSSRSYDRVGAGTQVELRARVAELRRLLAEAEGALEGADGATVPGEGEASLPSLFLKMPDGFAYCRMHFDAEGRPVDWTYLEVNPAFESLTGLGGVAGKRVSEVLPGLRDRDPKIFEVYGRVAATGRPERLESYVRTLDLWLSMSVYSPRPDHFAAVFESVAERRRDEEASRRSEGRFRTLFETMAQGVVYQDATGRIIDANRAAERILGVSRDVLTTRDSTSPEWRAIHPDGSPFPGREHPTMVALRTGEPVRDVMMGVHDPVSGECRWLLVSAVPFLRAGQSAPSYVYSTFEDLTELVRAERALRASESRLRAYLDQAADAVFVHDSGGRILDVNRRACEVLGYTREELLAMAVMDVDQDAELEAARGAWGRVEPGRTLQLSGTHRRKDGSTFPVEINLGAFDLEGVRVYMALARDITERLQAEQSLKESRERLQAIVNTAVDAIITIDGEGIVHSFNPAAERIFGYPADEILGRNISRLMPDSHRRDHAGYIARYRSTGQARVLGRERELMGVRKDGSTFHLEIGVSEFHTQGRKEFLGILRDISERKAVEAALRHSEQRYRQIVETAREGVWVHDMEGRTTFVNARMAEMLDYPADEINGRRIADFLLPEERAAFEESMERRRQGIGETHDLQYRRRDGSLLWAIVSASPLRDDAGEVVGVLKMVTDITERRRAEQELKASEQKFRELVRHIPGVVFQLRFREDGTHYISYLSPRVEEFFDLEVPLDSTGWALGANLLPDDRVRFFSSVHQSLAGWEDWRFEGRCLVRGGSVKWFQATASPHPEGDERVWYGLILDVTERKRAEEEIRNLNESLERRVAERTAEIEAMLDHTSVGLAFFDRDLRYLRINEALAGINGRPARDHVGRHIREIVPYLAEEVEESIRQVFETGRTSNVRDLEAPRRVGEPLRWWLINYFPVRRDDGFIFSVGVSVADITEQKRAERELTSLNRSLSTEIAEREQAEAKMRRLIAILESSPDFVAIADPGLRIVYANDALFRATGKRIESLTIRDLHSTEVAGSLIETALPIASREGVWRGESDLVTPEGRAIPVSQVILAHHDQDGRLSHYSTIMRDMSEQQQMERDLRDHAEELARANLELARASRLKDEFMANMSHELRTPLNGVLSMSQALAEGVYGPATAEQAQAFGDIESSGRHLLDIINDILDLTRIESGAMDVVAYEFSVEETCQAAIRMVAQVARKKRQGIGLAVDPAVSRVVSDERKLKQVLVNLLSNAVKFTDDGGSIGLVVEGDVSRWRLRFIVWDTGIGIASKDLERIFEPFTQVDSSLSRQYSGAGLGLALVKQMAGLLGGRVDVSSEPGRGSRFTLELDWVTPPHLPGPEPLGTTPRRDRPATSQPSIQDASTPDLVETLGAMGVRARAHPLDDEALRLLRAERPALLFLDAPHGYPLAWDWIDRLAADPDPSIRKVPVVLISSDDPPQTRTLPRGVTRLRPPVSRRGLESALSHLDAAACGEIDALVLAPGLPEPRSNVVLLAEDDAINARGVLDFLQTQGLCLALACDGEEAVRKTIELRPRVVLMDIHLPGLDGLEAIRRIRSSRTASATPIIAVTALAMPGDRERCLAAGADAYLSKPFRLRELLALIQGFVGPGRREGAGGAGDGVGEPDLDRG
ncbi:MAG: PAS domain S-box protein [Isosphaeraceae bacterium]